MKQLNIYASVSERDKRKREYLLAQLNEHGVAPRILGTDKIEFRHHGDRNTILELGELAYDFIAHSVHIWSD